MLGFMLLARCWLADVGLCVFLVWLGVGVVSVGGVLVLVFIRFVRFRWANVGCVLLCVVVGFILL